MTAERRSVGVFVWQVNMVFEGDGGEMIDCFERVQNIAMRGRGGGSHQQQRG